MPAISPAQREGRISLRTEAEGAWPSVSAVRLDLHAENPSQFRKSTDWPITFAIESNFDGRPVNTLCTALMYIYTDRHQRVSIREIPITKTRATNWKSSMIHCW